MSLNSNFEIEIDLDAIIHTIRSCRGYIFGKWTIMASSITYLKIQNQFMISLL